MKTQWQMLDKAKNVKQIKLTKVDYAYFAVSQPEIIRGPDIPMFIYTYDDMKIPYGYLDL